MDDQLRGVKLQRALLALGGETEPARVLARAEAVLSEFLGGARVRALLVSAAGALPDGAGDAAAQALASGAAAESASALALPVAAAGGQVLAVLAVDAPPAGAAAALRLARRPVAAALRDAALLQTTVAHSRRRQGVLEVLRTVGAGLEVDALIDGVIRALQRALSADRASFYLVDHAREELVCRVSRDVEGLRLPLRTGVVGAVALSGRLENIPDVYADARFSQAVDAQTGYRTRSMLCCPVVDAQGRVVAVLQALNKRGGASARFNEGDEAVIRTVAVEAAAALRNANLFLVERVYREHLQSLVEVARSLAGARSQQGQLSATVVQQAIDTLGAERCRVFVVEGSDLVTGELRVPVGDAGAPGAVAMTGVPESTGDTLCHPLSDTAGNVVGVVQLWGAVDPELVEVFASLAAAALVNAQLYGRLSAHSVALNSVVEAVQDHIFTLDGAGRLATANHAPELFKLLSCAGDCCRTQPFGEWLGSASAVLAADVAAVHAGAADHRARRSVPVAGGSIVHYDVFPLARAAAGAAAGGASSSDSDEAEADDAEELLDVVDEVVEQPAAAAADPRAFSTPPSEARVDGVVVLLQDVGEAARLREDLARRERELSEASFELEQLKGLAQELEDTPIERVVREMQELLRGGALDAAAQAEVRRCLRLMRSPDLFQPFFAEDQAYLRHEYQAAGGQQLAAQQRSGNTSSERLRLRSAAPALTDLSVLRSWDFNALEYRSGEEEELVPLAIDMLDELGLVEAWELPLETLHAAVQAIRQQYRANPYHNFHHAVTVLHVSFLLASAPQCRALLSTLDLYALMLAALCHDVDHPARTNAFEVNRRSELATLYNDRAVLENHHAATAFRTFARDGMDVFAACSVDERRLLRRRIVGAILATDMQRHFQLTAKLKTAFGDDPQVRVDVLLHAADLSNPVRPWPVAREWTSRLSEEFRQQALEEEELGLPVSPLQAQPLAKREVGFIDLLVQPLWSALADEVPVLRAQVEELGENRRQWSLLGV